MGIQGTGFKNFSRSIPVSGKHATEPGKPHLTLFLLIDRGGWPFPISPPHHDNCKLKPLPALKIQSGSLLNATRATSFLLAYFVNFQGTAAGLGGEGGNSKKCAPCESAGVDRGGSILTELARDGCLDVTLLTVGRKGAAEGLREVG